MPIDILQSFEVAILVGDDCEVRVVNADRRIEINAIVFFCAAAKVICNLLPIPIGGFAENDFSQPYRVADADAAMAECACTAFEQMFGRGVVHIDDLAIGHVEPDDTKGVECARVLSEHVTLALRRPPIDRPRVDFLAAPTGEYADALPVEVVDVLFDLRDQCALRDRLGNMPVGEQVDGLDCRLDLRGGRCRLADDDTAEKGDAIALDGDVGVLVRGRDGEWGAEREGGLVAGPAVGVEEFLEREVGEDVRVVDEDRLVVDPRLDVLDAAAGFEEDRFVEEGEGGAAVSRVGKGGGPRPGDVVGVDGEVVEAGGEAVVCLLYTSDAADDVSTV